jgi:iron(III) transport system substrate-binding protein
MKQGLNKIVALTVALFLTLGVSNLGVQVSLAKAKTSTIKVVTTSESYKPLFEKFTKETGVNVEYLSMSSGEVLSRIKAEGGKPMADVWFGGGIDSFMQAKVDGILEQNNFPDLKFVSSKFKDKNGFWVSKGLTIVGFIVNKDLLREKKLPEPTSWNDLLKPIYKNEIMMSNPAISGTNYAVVNAMLQKLGNTAGWEYFKKLDKNIEYYSKRGSDPSTKVAAGEVAIGITYIDKTLDKLKASSNVKIIYPKDGVPYIPDGVAVFKNASNTKDGKAFVQWLFKNENLRILAGIDQKTTMKLVMPAAALTIDFPKEKLIKIDLSLIGANRTDILNKWKSLVGSK